MCWSGFAKTVYLPKGCKRHRNVSEKTIRKWSASHLRKMPLMLGVLRKAVAETELILLFCRWRNSRDSGRSGGTCDNMLPERSSVWNTHKTSSSILFLHIWKRLLLFISYLFSSCKSRGSAFLIQLITENKLFLWLLTPQAMQCNVIT